MNRDEFLALLDERRVLTPTGLLEVVYRRRGVKKMIRRPTFAGSLRKKLHNKLAARKRARKRKHRKALGRSA